MQRMYFAHIMGLAIWFGALLVGILLLRTARAHVDQPRVTVKLPAALPGSLERPDKRG